jgi:hypothetical protein
MSMTLPHIASAKALFLHAWRLISTNGSEFGRMFITPRFLMVLCTTQMTSYFIGKRPYMAFVGPSPSQPVAVTGDVFGPVSYQNTGTCFPPSHQALDDFVVKFHSLMMEYLLHFGIQLELKSL